MPASARRAAAVASPGATRAVTSANADRVGVLDFTATRHERGSGATRARHARDTGAAWALRPRDTMRPLRPETPAYCLNFLNFTPDHVSKTRYRLNFLNLMMDRP